MSKRNAVESKNGEAKKVKVAGNVAGEYSMPQDLDSPNLAFVTKPAPFFKGTALMPNGGFEVISSNNYKGKWLVLFSYPLDWTFVCPTELVAFSDRHAEFSAINADIVGFSVDSEFSHLAWSEASRKSGGLGGLLKYPMLADKTHQLHRDFGVLCNGEGDNLRGLFIIDPKGVLRHKSINDPCVGRNVDEVLRLLNAYQHADTHGVVCPMGWTKGKKTIKNNPKDKLEYFKSV